MKKNWLNKIEKRECTIQATLAIFKSFKGEKSSHIHSLSEFIDNSIASWEKCGNENFYGLEIDIDVNSISNNDLKSQTITVKDNAGGMDSKELENAMEPNFTKGKSSNQINQYGVGLKLATFYLGSGIEIITRKSNKKECSLKLIVTEENENEKAKFNIISKEPEFFKGEKTGTIIKVLNVYSSPNRMIQKKDIFDNKSESGFGEICNALGWRYGGLINNGMKLSITYTDCGGNSEKRLISPFKPIAYSLSSVKKAFENKKSTQVNFEEYEKKLIENVSKFYLEKKKEIDEITGNKNFLETLKNNEPLCFEFESKIENKSALIKWGVLSMKESKENGSFNYMELEGFTLLHKGRAIKHGPNNSKINKSQGEVNISTFSFLNGESGGKTAVKRRLFGEIDLTNIETPERNKSEFIYGQEGKKDILEIQKKIWSAIREILNTIEDEEKSPDSIKIKSPNDSQKKCKNIEEMISNQILTTNVEVSSETCKIILGTDDKINEFIIVHTASESNDDFFECRDVTENSMKIFINTNHYLVRDLLKDNDSKSQQIKANLVYPLAIVLGICNVQQDKKESFNHWKLLGGSAIHFNEVFNNILKKIKEK